MKIWTFDAFVTDPRLEGTGNPGAVLLMDDFPDDGVMQGVAAELAISNTGFVKEVGDNQFQIRWFTPNAPAPLCGHVTLGATAALYRSGLCGARVTYHSQSAVLHATYNRDWVELDFPAYPPTRIDSNEDIIAAISPFAEHVSFIGVAKDVVLLELSDPDMVRHFKPDYEAIVKLPYRAIITTAADKDYDFITRYFAPKVMIPEDPVCGSSFTRLTPYWSDRLGKTEMLSYHASPRGGVIRCALHGGGVKIYGQVSLTMEGDYHLPHVL